MLKGCEVVGPRMIHQPSVDSDSVLNAGDTGLCVLLGPKATGAGFWALPAEHGSHISPPPRGHLPHPSTWAHLVPKSPGGWLPFLCLIKGSFLRVGERPANPRSGGRQGLHALQGPGAGHQAAVAGPRHPGVLRQEEGVPAVRLGQIVSTEPRAGLPGRHAVCTPKQLLAQRQHCRPPACLYPLTSWPRPTS